MMTISVYGILDGEFMSSTVKNLCVVLIIGIILAIVAMFAFPTRFASWGGLVLWLVSLILLGISCMAIGSYMMESKLGLLIDGRNKVSLSRLQTVLWTIVVLSGLLAAVVWNLSRGGSVQPLNIVIPPDLWFLMGITTAALAVSPIIKNEKGKLSANDNVDKASFSDIFKGEEEDNKDRLDLGKVQMFYLTLIIVFAYAVEIAHLFSGSEAISSFPEISSGMVTLLGISNAGYLAYKAAPHNTPTA
jgi:hypothetical protein